MNRLWTVALVLGGGCFIVVFTSLLQDIARSIARIERIIDHQFGARCTVCGTQLGYLELSVCNACANRF